MAKKKARTTGWDRPVTEQADGALTWETDGFRWWWLGGGGFNLGLIIAGDRCHGRCHARDLREAGLLAEGYGLGHLDGRFRQTAPEV